MELHLERRALSPKTTIGQLFVDGWFECLVLEDVVRAGAKVADQTAIPAGRYQVVITLSARFKVPLPLLLAVPGFDGIRIHAGNTAKDTSGCLLVGRVRAIDMVLESRLALTALQPKIAAALDAGEPVFITIDSAKE